MVLTSSAIRPAAAAAADNHDDYDRLHYCFVSAVRNVTSAAPINQWAANVTKGLIKQAVPANIKFNTVLTNAVYFKASTLVYVQDGIRGKAGRSAVAAGAGTGTATALSATTCPLTPSCLMHRAKPVLAERQQADLTVVASETEQSSVAMSRCITRDLRGQAAGVCQRSGSSNQASP
jgi:hypothetical protein